MYAEVNGVTLVDDHSIQWHHEKDDVIPVNRFLRNEEKRLKRIPKTAELTWLEINVNNIQKSLQFYQNTLGLAVLPTDRTDTKTLVLPEDHSQQIVLNEVPGIAPHDYEELGIDYVSFKMIRAKDVDALYDSMGAAKDAAHYDEIDHLLFLNDPDQINLTFSVW
ncbi:VOC family protein [Nicoliella lavandulae]|uniref:VOC family protein n=1 Tax=Nicoliella lavandulae TaxID=3082954 RepID=A0ABU8SM65_9LACO